MPTYQKCGPEIASLAAEILCAFDTHKPVLDAKVKIDYVFAYPTRNENGDATGPAISKGGVKALGMCRKIGLKDRAMGRGDVEITIDYEWWQDASDESKRALLDHELHHIEIIQKEGKVDTDDLNRPKVKMRGHDYEFGWFTIIAARHGNASIERQQAKEMLSGQGQMIFDFERLPMTQDDGSTVTFSMPGMESITLTDSKLKRAAAALKGAAKKLKTHPEAC